MVAMIAPMLKNIVAKEQMFYSSCDQKSRRVAAFGWGHAPGPQPNGLEGLEVILPEVQQSVPVGYHFGCLSCLLDRPG